MSALIFIDTNILLDFYRYPQGSAVLPILDHIDKNHEKIITGNQVEMEFKKNRQKVILESISLLKGPNWENLKIPVFLSEAKPSQVISNSKTNIEKQLIKLQKRIESVLRDPAHNDQVYQVAQRLFRNNDNLNLTREDKIRFSIRRLAQKRFILGYPPRKPNDTSLGDPINWEWIIHCAKDANKDVVIVSRDSDYGYRYGNEPIINDWLLQEFRDRVSRKKKVTLTNRLTHAFELTKIAVKQKEVEDEKKLIFELSTTNLSSNKSYEDLLAALAHTSQYLTSLEQVQNPHEDIFKKIFEKYMPKQGGKK